MLAALTLVALVVIAFFPAFQAGFVWDDTIFTEEPLIQRASGLWNIWFSPGDIRKEAHYWPLTYTTFWLEHKLWGLTPLGYHVVNVLLYLGNVLLLWRLCARLAVPGAWAATAIWAVHPLHVESVVWVIERKDVLSGLCYLGAALAYVRYSETNRRRHYGLGLALYALGLLAKSAVVTLPATMLIWHWYRQGRLQARHLVRTAPFFLVGLLISIGDMAFYRSREVLSLDYSMLERTLIAARALWHYAGKLFWPDDLMVIYPLWDIDAADPLAWTWLVAAALFFAGLWFGRGRVGRAPLAAVLFFAVTLSPALGFVDYGYMQFSFVADRFQYLAGFGLIAVVVGASVQGARRFPSPYQRTALALLAPVLLFLGTTTWRQARVYSDEATFFGHIVSLNPVARGAHLNLAPALIAAGRPEESVAAARVAVENEPESADAYTNLAAALNAAGRREESLAAARVAVQKGPKSADAHTNLAAALNAAGRREESLAAARVAVQKGPKSTDAYSNLGRALLDAGDLEGAERQFRTALELTPRDLGANQNLAETLRRQERYDEAALQFRRVLAFAEDYALAWGGLGEALFRAGRYEEAVEPLDRALSIDPDLSIAGGLHLVQGRSLLELNRLPAAERSLLRAAELAPDDPQPLLELAKLLSLQQRADEAELHRKRAMELGANGVAALHAQAEALRGRQRIDAALDAYREALELEPNYAPALAGMGAAMFQLQRYEDAVDTLGQALAIDADLPEASSLYCLMGRAQHELGYPEEAAEQFERCLALDPRAAEALDHLALLRFRAKRHEEALDLYRRLVEARPAAAGTHANIGIVLIALERYDEAVRSLERSLALDPGQEMAKRAIADARGRSGAGPGPSLP